MTDKRVVLSSRIDPEVSAKVDKLVQHFQEHSVGTVNKRVVIEKAINELYHREIDNGLSDNEKRGLELGAYERLELILTIDVIERLNEYISETNTSKNYSDAIRTLIDNAYMDHLRKTDQL